RAVATGAFWAAIPITGERALRASPVRYCTSLRSTWATSGGAAGAGAAGGVSACWLPVPLCVASVPCGGLRGFLASAEDARSNRADRMATVLIMSRVYLQA